MYSKTYIFIFIGVVGRSLNFISQGVVLFPYGSPLFYIFPTHLKKKIFSFFCLCCTLLPIVISTELFAPFYRVTEPLEACVRAPFSFSLIFLLFSYVGPTVFFARLVVSLCLFIFCGPVSFSRPNRCNSVFHCGANISEALKSA